MCQAKTRDEAATTTPAQRARAIGSVVAAATGDALGAPYEFQSPIPASDDVTMTGGGILDWEPGEWTDDTAMAIVVLEAVASSADPHDLRVESTLDQVARDWYAWSIGTPDIGSLTSAVVSAATRRAFDDGHGMPRARDFRAAAQQVHDQTAQNDGNGALMRTHVVALPYLHRSDDELAAAVIELCRLTHRGVDAEEACLLWTFAVRHAILTGEVDVRVGLPRLPPERTDLWRQRIEEAESAAPCAFARNGWVVHAFQAAWSAVHSVTPLPECKFERRAAMTAALEAAVRAGYDTDTVASITGALMGAALGPKAVQPEWRRALFGWPGYEVGEIVALVDRVLDGTKEQAAPCPVAAPGPPEEPPSDAGGPPTVLAAR